MEHDCRDYFGKIWYQSENVYSIYKLFVANVQLDI